MTVWKPIISVLLAALATPALLAAETSAADGKDPQHAVRLGTISVTGQQLDTSYTRTDASGASKTDTPLLETPQAVSVISDLQMRDQSVLTVQDALRYSAGVRSDVYGVDSRGDDGFIRGTSFSQYLDGLRQYFGYSYARTEPYTLTRVEVVRGPSSVLYGQGTTGGLIALSSKQPQDVASREVEVQLGNHASRQLAFDFTGPLDERGHWSYRLIGVARDADAQMQHVPDDRRLLAPSIAWTPSEDTRLTVLGNLQFDRSGTTLNFLPHAGTLLPNPNGRIPTDRFTSEPGFDNYDTDQRLLTSLFEHRFNDTWRIVQNLRYSHDNVDYRTLYPDIYSNPANPFVDDAQREVTRYSYVSIDRHRRLVTDTHAQADVDFAGLHHRVLLGLDAGRSRTDSRQGNGVADIPFDLYAPVYGRFTPPEVLHAPSSVSRQTGVYLQDQIEAGEHWLATLGLRRDFASIHTDGSDTLHDSATTQRLGMMYRFTSGIVPYLSYTESFQPLDSLDFYHRPYRPLRGKQYEAGVKIQPAGSDSLLTATWFDLRENNRLAPDPQQPLNRIQSGRQRTRGVELEASTHLARHLDLLGNYTYTDARPDDGSIVAGLPRHQGSLWGVWHFGVDDADGFSAGAGVRYIGDNTDETGQLHLPAQTLVDAMIAYSHGPWRLSLNAANLGDRIYEATCLARGDCFYGPRRSVVGAVRYRFE